MKWLKKLLGVVPEGERRGLTLDLHSAWEVLGGTPYIARFLRALRHVVSGDALLYLEGGSHSPSLTAFLDSNKQPERARIQMNTIWPRPKVYHLPATEDFLDELARRVEGCAIQEVCAKLCIYRDEIILLEGDDILSGPIHVSKAVPTAAVEAFCKELGLTYREYSFS